MVGLSISVDLFSSSASEKVTHMADQLQGAAMSRRNSYFDQVRLGELGEGECEGQEEIRL